MKCLPQIEVAFILSSDEDYIEKISVTLDITPSKTRKRNDFKFQELASNEWWLTSGKKHSRAIDYQFVKVIEQLKDKEIKIKELVEKYNVKSRFNVSIHAKDGDGPEVFLTKEVVSFVAKIDAEILFSLYYY